MVKNSKIDLTTEKSVVSSHMKLFHRSLGEVSLNQTGLSFLLATENEPDIEVCVISNQGVVNVDRRHLSFTPFIEYPKPRICVIVEGGKVDNVLSNDSWVEVEVIDFDRMNLSTNQKEKIFEEKLENHKHSLI